MNVSKHLNKTNIMWCCLLVLVYFVTHGFVKYGLEHYTDNLLPEFTGVFFELFVVLLVFNKWQEREASKQKIAKEKRLREFLIFIINEFSNFKSMPESFSFYGLSHTENQTVLNRLKSEFTSEKSTPSSFRHSFIYHCQVDVDALTALLPVAADLSEEHFKSWARIVYYIKKSAMLDISVREDFEQFDEYIIKLIDYIRRFDKASFDNKIYHGAI
ncbi:hypothetical protein AB4251_11970 [Vibrio lentus]|uniref:DUF4760 domain-containing protein n=1 Tax=Vibrio lentus TaxID=136468 RepID=A0AB36XG52_9VIBR|nr:MULTISPECIES: hypothetical protein [Vibrio]MCC4837302.1 hypothetical protein [Vibrio lentus]MCG9640892.1 hypothetical protein [Vibrio sp. Isolate34]MDH5928621.1 hypothetical protein [Vibrio lentus]PMI13895.1 hypothetical protein BCU51_07275 [Vibrio lentus]PMK33855.1 hypothetical protein BCU02_20770 [Vibrio lentus]